MDQNPGDIIAPVPLKGHQSQVLVHPEPDRVPVRVKEVLQIGMGPGFFVGLEETSIDGPVTAGFLVSQAQDLLPCDGAGAIGSDDTVSPDDVSRGQGHPGFVLLLEILGD